LEARVTLSSVSIKGYRSIKELHLPLRQLTVLTGGNGVGKTNLYRSLELLRAAAAGTLAAEIAREGGLGSVFWAGGKNLSPTGEFDPKYRTDGYRKGEPNRLSLEATFEDFGTYSIELGFAQKGVAAFGLEAQVKAESLHRSVGGKKTAVLERDGQSIRIRKERAPELLAGETALANLSTLDPLLGELRAELGAWRFYHGFRTDPDSPLRQPAPAITAPLLNSDGSNLAAVFATLRHIREETIDLDDAIEIAFPGAELVVPTPEDHATFGMRFPEMPKRAFEAHELSDGTLQFLALMGALLSYRAPPLVALNEPEASLHPGLLPALAKTIAKAAERTQIWVVTHSSELAGAIADETGAVPREVVRTDDGTSIKGLTRLGNFEDDD
jgi:predicted ATPase